MLIPCSLGRSMRSMKCESSTKIATLPALIIVRGRQTNSPSFRPCVPRVEETKPCRLHGYIGPRRLMPGGRTFS